ncbi:hypothetical protein [Streptomyces sp. NPDC001970]
MEGLRWGHAPFAVSTAAHRAASGALWRYNGTGAGTFAARVKIGPGWQAYKTLH